MLTSESLEARVRARVNALAGAELLRTLRSPHGIDFSSNDYLALSKHPLLKERMIEASRREGCGSTGSPLLRGHRESFSAVEQTFAALVDWHEVAALVARGCPPDLALEIAR